jgi:hypothetical protein
MGIWFPNWIAAPRTMIPSTVETKKSKKITIRTLNTPGTPFRLSQRTGGVRISAAKIEKKKVTSIGAISRIPIVRITAAVLYNKILTGIE